MYNRKRIARGAGSALATWALVGILVMSSGVAYALPLAGVGGFITTADSVTADQAVIYPGVARTSDAPTTTDNKYPVAVVELKNPRIEDLTIMKDIALDRYTAGGLNGDVRILINAGGTSTGDSILVKSSYVASPEAEFNDFQIKDRAGDEPSQQYQLWSNGTTVLEDPSNDGDTVIRTHYLVSDTIQLDNLGVEVWYDLDGDGTYEYNNAPVGDDAGDTDI